MHKRDPRPRLRPHLGRAGGSQGDHRLPRPHRHAGLQGRKFMWWTFNMPTDHAEVSITDVRVPDDAILGGEGEGLMLAQHLRPREPHPPGRLERRRRPVLHRRGGRVRQRARDLGQAAVDQPGASSSPWSSCTPKPRWCAAWSASTAWELDRQQPHRGHRQGLDGQLPRQPPGLRGRRPRDAGPRRHRLHPPQALRAHLPPPPPLPDHRGLRRRSRCARSRPSSSASPGAGNRARRLAPGFGRD